MISRERWLAEGRSETLDGRRLFFREGGTDGRHLTLLHGFPTCSWDWSKVWPRLAEERRLLAPDLLGFGASEKPAIRYDFFSHADRLEALWSARGVKRTTLVAHDYSVTVALELMARRREGPTSTEIDAVVMLNGAYRSTLHRPRRLQKLLVSPLGPLIARFMTRRRFAASFREVFVKPPTEAELDAFWASIANARGHLRTPSLLHYLADRHAHAARWEAALDESPLPLTLVWGVEDPVSGAHVLERAPARATIRSLPVGHYPHWEAPAECAAAILDA